MFRRTAEGTARTGSLDMRLSGKHQCEVVHEIAAVGRAGRDGEDEPGKVFLQKDPPRTLPQKLLIYSPFSKGGCRGICLI